jgi:hypothetical protein
MRTFAPHDRLSRTNSMIATELDQETVLMSIDAGAYYGLEGPARSIWEKLKTPLTFAALVEELVREYNISPETCAADIQVFLNEMEKEGLLQVN